MPHGVASQVLKKPQGRPQKCGKNCHIFNLGNTTARELGSLFGSGERKIRYAYEFARAVDKVREVKPEAAQRSERRQI